MANWTAREDFYAGPKMKYQAGDLLRFESYIYQLYYAISIVDKTILVLMILDYSFSSPFVSNPSIS